MKNSFDVFIIGGGPAGLSAALTLARGGRSVFVMDSNQARNAPASHMMNFPSRDGTPPTEFRNFVKMDLLKYERVVIKEGEVKSVARDEDRFVINGEIRAKKILLAHGIRDVLPPIPGFRELWGKAIFHCPYCHGYEHRGAKIGLLADAKIATHLAPLLKGLTDELVYIQLGNESVDEDRFAKNGISVFQSAVEALQWEGEKLQGLTFASGESISLDFLFYRPKHEFSTALGVNLGCEVNEFGLYKIDGNYMTTVDGVYAAGDVTELKQSVLFSSTAGSGAGAMMNFAIQQEEFNRS